MVHPVKTAKPQELHATKAERAALLALAQEQARVQAQTQEILQEARVRLGIEDQDAERLSYDLARGVFTLKPAEKKET